MDLGRLVQGLLNRLLRKAVTKGITAGIDQVARRGKPADQMTPEDHAQARRARYLAKRARQAARITRRFGR